MSAGNAESLCRREPERVLGGDTLLDGTPAATAAPIPVRNHSRRRQPDGPARADGHDMVRAVHYLNQFFAGLGGEEAAETPPTWLDGPVGPGRGLAAELEGTEIGDAACGDDYFGEHEEGALSAAARACSRPSAPICPLPAPPRSGRYGFACARFFARRRRAARHPGRRGDARGEPGSRRRRRCRPDRRHRRERRRHVREAPPRMARSPRRSSPAARWGRPPEGYVPRGFRRNELAGRPGADRAIDLLLGYKLGGETRSEVAGGSTALRRPRPS